MLIGRDDLKGQIGRTLDRSAAVDVGAEQLENLVAPLASPLVDGSDGSTVAKNKWIGRRREIGATGGDRDEENEKERGRADHGSVAVWVR
ncbi:MAG: hypothetical protein IAE82_03215 [Opitutaceae bacterium]|nr:hypothetical protein [Opitutaceae bacterium]